MKEFIDVILNQEPEKYEYPYVVHAEGYQGYEKVLFKLASMKGKGLCDFSYDSLFQPYMLHCIEVNWNKEDEMVELEAKDIVEICSLVEDVVIDSKDGDWQLSSAIYKKLE